MASSAWIRRTSVSRAMAGWTDRVTRGAACAVAPIRKDRTVNWKFEPELSSGDASSD